MSFASIVGILTLPFHLAAQALYPASPNLPDTAPVMVKTCHKTPFIYHDYGFQNDPVVQLRSSCNTKQQNIKFDV